MSYRPSDDIDVVQEYIRSTFVGLPMTREAKQRDAMLEILRKVKVDLYFYYSNPEFPVPPSKLRSTK